MVGITHPGQGGDRWRYYKCCGREPVCPSHQPRCTRPNVRADDLDAAVWSHIRRLLDDPATLAEQFESFARPASEATSTPHSGERKVEVQLRRLDREEVRLVDAYQAEVIDLDELRERRQRIQERRQVLITSAAEQEKLHSSRQEARAVWRELAAFCERIRSRLEQLDPLEKQRILQLLVERIIVGEDTLEIRHVIPLRALKSESPEGAMPCGRSGRSDAEGASPERPEVRLRTDRVGTAPVLDDEQRRRLVIELLAALGADLESWLATLGAAAFGLGQLVEGRDTREVLGQSLAAVASLLRLGPGSLFGSRIDGGWGLWRGGRRRVVEGVGDQERLIGVESFGPRAVESTEEEIEAMLELLVLVPGPLQDVE
jgi:hypothetical protein